MAETLDIRVCERCNNAMESEISESVFLNATTKARENDIKTALLLQKSKTKTTFQDVSVIKNIHKIAKDKNRKGLNICYKCVPFLEVLVKEKLAYAKDDQKNLEQEIINLKREIAENHAPNELHQSQILLEQLNEEEEKLQEQLNELNSQIESENLEEIKNQLEEKEKMLWNELNGFESELDCFKKKRKFLEAKRASINHMSNILNSNPPSSFFQIVNDPPSINSILFGIIPNRPVNWSEINMAWGLCALLLKIFAEKLKYEFVYYDIVPLGCKSEVVRKDEKKPYSLYHVEQSMLMSFSNLLWTNTFDKAMVGYLTCLKEICDHIITTYPRQFAANYPIVIDSQVHAYIGTCAIKRQNNSDSKWTSALTKVLATLKDILVFFDRRYLNQQ